MTINLQSGLGTGGDADGSTYAFTNVAGYNSINSIIGGSGNDAITGSKSNDTLNGGLGSDSLTGGEGTNILIGGGGGTDDYYMGKGSDTIVGGLSTYDRLWYNTSTAGVVVNLDSVSHSFVNSLGATINVAAYSGANFAVNANDANSFSIGDYYTVLSGTNTSIDEIRGSTSADQIYAGSAAITYYNYGGADNFFAGTGGSTFLGYDQVDTFIGNSGTDNYYFSNGKDLADGGSGYNVIRTNSWYSGDYNVVTYLDASADTNSNGIADSIDRGVGSLTSGGVTYTGFEYGWGNAVTGANSTLLKNFDNVVGNSVNDYIVGNANANEINARAGVNTIFGLGGNDIITAIEGYNTIDGGTGTDTVNFQYATGAISGQLSTASPNYTYGVQVFLGDATFLAASDKTSYWGAGFSQYQARTGTTGAYFYDTITNVENINGSDFDDVLYGNSGNNFIYGNSGNDIIAGNGGVDSLYAGAGNDTFKVLSTDIANVTIFDGGAGTDTLYSSGFVFAANSIANAKYSSIETVDVRNSVSGQNYGLSSTDIQSFADAGNASVVNLKLDTGDVFAAATGSFTVVTGSGSDFQYKYYNNVAHTTLLATLNLHYGPG